MLMFCVFRIELGLCLPISLPSLMSNLNDSSPPLQLAWTKWENLPILISSPFIKVSFKFLYKLPNIIGRFISV